VPVEVVVCGVVCKRGWGSSPDFMLRVWPQAENGTMDGNRRQSMANIPMGMQDIDTYILTTQLGPTPSRSSEGVRPGRHHHHHYHYHDIATRHRIPSPTVL
jgi:hypothetical protein